MPNPTASRTTGKATASNAAEKAALDSAFDALKAYDFGSGRAALLPIDEAVVAALADPAARRELERRLAAVLKSAAPSVAQEYACGKLALIGSADSVPALRELLADNVLSTAARNALESIPDSAAAKALRESLPRLSGAAKVGAINSLGRRRDAGSVSTLARLLTDKEIAIATAAVDALGNIASAHAAKELRKFQPKAPDALAHAIADACLNCAERLLADNHPGEALAMYKTLNGCRLPAHFKSAVSHGLSTAAR